MVCQGIILIFHTKWYILQSSLHHYFFFQTCSHHKTKKLTVTFKSPDKVTYKLIRFSFKNHSSGDQNEMSVTIFEGRQQLNHNPVQLPLLEASFITTCLT